MLYNQHGERTGPGPLATPDWIGEILGYARTQCDLARIVPVVKTSGTEWGPQGVRSLRHDQTLATARQRGATILRDAASGVPYYRYGSGRENGVVFFEDAVSLSRKVAAIEALGFSRIMFWSLGAEDPAFLPEASRQAPPAGGH